ncbi:hypothetical protein OOZ63_19830 [Paucibacter sp. PLA-PC-4]|uniref:lysophospholipid acyltransferase family protein n=1 Tax=Paucibacter sp. PLA-PC-4 TaxID=2993655 RepID=UPI00224A87C9|nr:hypothetical protein [Paucibacter sp. PLA-PC-4]MCX2864081.1 hypothetical protein [Paucibacter sp. PLA-PC-4]
MGAGLINRAVVLLMGLLGRLSARQRQRVAGIVALLILRCAKRTDTRLAANLALAMPQLDAAQRRTLALRSYRNICLGVLDTFWLDKLRLDIEFSDSAARRIIEGGGGASIVTLHMGCYEVVALAVQRLTGRSTTMSNIPPHLRCVSRLYQAAGIACVHKNKPGGFFELVRAAKRGGYVTLHGDHYGSDMPVNFFGHATQAPGGAVMLAALASKPLLLGYAVLSEAGRYRVVFETLVEHPLPRQPAELAWAMGRVYRRFEQVIRQHPEHWYWSYKRWRTPITA